MKTLLCLCTALSVSLMVHDVHASDHFDGQILTVTANAGLRLRMAPDMHARTISILTHGQEVVVENTFGYPEEHRDRVEWMDGYWIKVNTGTVSGYVFDGFLSSLPLPSHERQLCMDCDNIIHPLDQYLFDTFEPVSMHDGPDNSEEITQVVTCLEDSICTTRTTGGGWYQFETHFSNKRINDIIGLMRSLIVGRDMLDAFNASLIFHEDRQGMVEKVDITLFSSPVSVESTPGGVRVSSMIISAEDGC